MAMHSTATDHVQRLWNNYQDKVRLWEADGAGAQGDCESKRAMDRAEETFIKTRTTSLPGILAKLEHIAEIDNMARALQKHPDLTVNRVVLGLIRDLRAELGMQRVG